MTLLVFTNNYICVYAPPAMSTEHLSEAIEIAGGSQKKLADKIGFSQMAVCKAVRSGLPSARMAADIERATEGAITREQLRPDLFGPIRPDVITEDGAAA